MKLISYFFIFSLILPHSFQEEYWSGDLPESALVSGGIQYPTLNLIFKNEQPQQALYRFKKGNEVIVLQLKAQGGAVLVNIKKGQNQVLAQGKFVRDGNMRKVIITQTQSGMLAYWHFALDRVTLSGGKTLSLVPVDADYSDPLSQCLSDCYRRHLMTLITADNLDRLIDRASQTSQTSGSGGCGEISVCTAGALSEYEQCVQDCYDEFGE
ncbi:MAG: hypothetical protein R3C61_09585 [Bacteroidia bacterium]